MLDLLFFFCFDFNGFFYFSQLDEIIRDPTSPVQGEEHLAALTAGERPLWAEARETYFRTGVNRYSLEAIEKAAFVLILDDEDFEIGTVSLFN
jgi:carnitine O-palmitoyltransferase 1